MPERMAPQGGIAKRREEPERFPSERVFHEAKSS